MAVDSVILTQIRTALAQHLKKDVAKVQPDHKLREDLGLDSLSTLELLFKLEEAFDMEIPNEDLPRLSTVQSVADYIEERLAAGDGHVPAAPGALAALASQSAAAAASATNPTPAVKPMPAAKPVPAAKATPVKTKTPAKRAAATESKTPAKKAAAPAAKARARRA